MTALNTGMLRVIMLDVINAKCHLCQVSFMPSVIYAKCHLCQVSFMPSVIYAKCHLCQVSFMPSVIYAKCHLCQVSFMLSVANESTMMSVIMLNVVAPIYLNKTLGKLNLGPAPLIN